MHINDLLTTAVNNGASDLHLKAGSAPMMRVAGGLIPVPGAKKLTPDDTIAMAAIAGDWRTLLVSKTATESNDTRSDPVSRTARCAL